jgi:predicted SnoaL-like aldol condensation-catalyzing enzyme
LDDDFVGHAGAVEFSAPDLLAFRASLGRKYRQLVIRTRETIVHDDRVAAAWTTKAIRDTESTDTWTGITMYRIGDGRICEIWDVRAHPHMTKGPAGRR